MDALVQDLRYAARQLLRRPGFGLIVVATLALGIGANAAVFSVVNAVLLRPLPYAAPERVVVLSNTIGDRADSPISGPEYFDYRDQLRTLDDLAAYRSTDVNLFGAAEPERIATTRVTPNLFSVLGTAPALGRTFTAEETAADPDSRIVLSHELWHRRFGANPRVLGTTVELNGVPTTIVGVMPRGFGLPDDFSADVPTELWMPLGLTPADPDTRGRRTLRAIGRLAPGATAAQANGELRALTGRWEEEGLSTTTERFSAMVTPAAEKVTGEVRVSLLILFGAVGLVLLIACANVANLLMTRADERRREFAVRTALGAGRGRLLRHLMAEGALLAVAGGVLGLTIAELGIRFLGRYGSDGIPRLQGVEIDGGVLAFTASVVLVTAVLVGLVPALRASGFDLGTRLREGSRGSTGGRDGQRLRQSLVVSEVALAVILLVGAGLLLRSFSELNRVDLGFQPENVLTMQITLPTGEYADADAMTRFFEEAVGRVRQLPGVEAAGAVAALPLAEPVGDWGIDIDGRERAEGERFFGYLQVATPGYHESLRVALTEGRLLGDSDGAGGVPVVVVNRSLADLYWPGGDAIGNRIRIRGFEGEWFTIVGVVADARHNEILQERRPEMFFPHAQLPMALGGTVPAMTITARTAGAPMGFAGAVREEIRAIDPRLPVASVRPMEEVVSEALAQQRFTTFLLAVFAAVALLLGVIGIYGVVAYAVASRIPEIGIRMALGADRARILAMTLRQGLALVGVGLLLGMLGALAASRLLAGMLYGVTAADPLTLAAVPLLLATVTVFASWIPARRAARVEPVEALRAG
jgi:putative ABC transport system permease protein